MKVIVLKLHYFEVIEGLLLLLLRLKICIDFCLKDRETKTLIFPGMCNWNCNQVKNVNVFEAATNE